MSRHTSEPAADARRRLRDELPYYGSDDLESVQLAEVYARLVAVAVGRAEFYGELLAEAYRREGIGALVGHKMDAVVVGGGRGMPSEMELYATSEEIRGLVELEGRERDRAERLTREAIKLGVQAKQVDAMRAYGRTVAESMRALALELGLDWTSELLRRAAQRAVLAARQTLGYDYRGPEAAGPRLSEVERAAVLDLDRGEEPF